VPFPLLSGVPTSTIDAVHARAAWLDVAAGEEVTRRWESDRFFCIVLSGRYDIRGARDLRLTSLTWSR
jgi:hypothetical protein